MAQGQRSVTGGSRMRILPAIHYPLFTIRFALLAATALALAGCSSNEAYVFDVAHNALYAAAETDTSNAQYDSAIRKLEQAVKYKPEKADTHFRLGNVLALRALQPDAAGDARQQFLARALAQHQTCVQLAPKEPVYLYMVGRDFVLLERPAEAFPPLTGAQQLAPNVPLIDARLGDARRLMKQYDEATRHYQAGLAKPAMTGATMELHEGLAETLAAQGKTAEALQELELARKNAISQAHAKRLAKRIEELKAPATRPAAP